MNYPCNPSRCRICRPGRYCAATARWLEEEAYFEDKDYAHDEARARMWAQRRPGSEPNTYLDAWGVEHWADPAYKHGRPKARG